jgi:hypothetical protein
MRPLVLRCAGVRSRQRSVCAHLVNEDQLLSLDLLSDYHSPGRSQELVSFQRPHSPFFERSPAASLAALRWSRSELCSR